MTRAHARLLGPCFKTGRVGCRPIRHRPEATTARRARARRAVRDHCGAARPVSNAPGRPETEGRGKRPRSSDVSTSAACTLSGHHEGAPSHLAAGLLTAAEPVVALGAGESAPCLQRASHAAASETDRCHAAATAGWAEFPGPTLRIHPFASMRFHVLLNSLFKVLFNFPSRYLSAIGLVPVFSLRWSLPPALGCIPKQPDSEAARRRREQSRHGPDTRSG